MKDPGLAAFTVPWSTRAGGPAAQPKLWIRSQCSTSNNFWKSPGYSSKMCILTFEASMSAKSDMFFACEESLPPDSQCSVVHKAHAKGPCKASWDSQLDVFYSNAFYSCDVFLTLRFRSGPYFK